MIRRAAAAVGAALLGSASLGAAPVAQSSPTHDIKVRLTPHMAGGAITTVDVMMTLRAPAVAAGGVLLKGVRQFAGYASQFDAHSLIARDARGPLRLTVADAAGTDTIADRTWTVDRATSGDVTIGYTAQVSTAKRVPHIDFRSEGGAATGSGLAFLPTPVPVDAVYRMRLSWDLHALPTGARGVWAWGEGDVDHVGPVYDLANSYYAVGSMQSYVRGTFGTYWFSPPPFDAVKLASSTGTILTGYEQFFRRRPESYRVFLRQHSYYRNSGTALAESFTLGYNIASPPDGRTIHVIAHEMAHTFLRPFSADSQRDAWYAEGGAEYYSNVLPFRMGTFDSASFLVALDETMSNYYPRPSRLMSIDAAARDGFFTGNSVQQLAYGRGRLYLAAVNSRIRAATRGKHSLDDVTLRINALADAGQPHGEDVWLSLVENFVGPQARRDHAAFRAGELVVPASDAFGPCFRRVRADVPQFDLGFDEQLLFQKDAVIAAIRSGSPADRAGLRPGDVIVKVPPLDRIYADPTRTLTLAIRRGSEMKDVTFLPRMGSIEAYRWERIPSIPEVRCREL